MYNQSTFYITALSRVTRTQIRTRGSNKRKKKEGKRRKYFVEEKKERKQRSKAFHNDAN